MELLSFPEPPGPFQLAVVKYVEGKGGSIAEHFPGRDLRAFSEKRIEEHKAVTYAISHILNHKNWHIEHGEDGAPELFENATRSIFAISTSHCSDTQNGTLAAVCLSEGIKKVGVDIVLKGDERVAIIAHRTMSERELVGEQLDRVWAVKESMFKALGPGLDFKNDLEVFVETRPVTGKVRGEASKWWVEETGGMLVALGPI